MKELIDFSSLDEAFGLPMSEPVLVDWDECTEVISGTTKGFKLTEGAKKLLREHGKRRAASPEGRVHLSRNGTTTMTKMQGDVEFQKKRLKGLRAKCELTWNIQKGDVTEQLTLKQFIDKHGGNLGSLKQMVWKKGAYKGWVFTKQEA